MHLISAAQESGFIFEMHAQSWSRFKILRILHPLPRTLISNLEGG